MKAYVLLGIPTRFGATVPFASKKTVEDIAISNCKIGQPLAPYATERLEKTLINRTSLSKPSQRDKIA